VFATTPDGSNAGVERMRITSAGLVGIGTSAPTAPLTVIGANNATQAIFGGALGTTGRGLRIATDVLSGNNDIAILDAQSPGGGLLGTLVFQTASTERMRITSTGNVGIGTTSPGSALEINATAATSPFIAKINTSEVARIDSSGRLLVGTSSARTGVFYNGDANAIPRLQIEAAGTGAASSASAAIGIVRNSDVAGAQPYLAFARTRGTTLGSASVVSSGDGIGTISFQGADGTDFVEAASITAQVDGTPGANDMPGRLVFSTTADGAATPTERLRINALGNMLLGGTQAPASAAKAFCIFNGTAPTGSVTDGVVLYAEDVSASSELKVRDEAGNVTTLSPHNFDLIPEGPSEEMAWSYYSERDGKRINVDMLKAIRLLEQLSGEKLVYSS